MRVDGIEVVHRDAHLLVVTKPSGLATTAPRREDCLTRRLEGELGERLHPTSRLDAEVTGLVTFAITKEAIVALREARAEGRYGRGYLAIAGEAPSPPTGRWTWSIAIDPRDERRRVALDDGERGERVQRAESSYHVRERVPRAAALWLTPRTGRTHQLRVHAARAGCPLLGDVGYGGDKRVVLDDGSVVTARRTMLHCAWLSLPRIGGDGTLDLEAPAPPDMVALWAALGGEGAALGPTPHDVT